MWLWVSAIAFIGLWWVFNRETKGVASGGGHGHGRGSGGGRGGGKVSGGFKATLLRLCNFTLFVLGTLSLWLAPMGSWGNIASLLAWLFGKVLGWVGAHWFAGLPASGLAFALSIPLLGAIGLDLWGRKPDKVARFGLLVLVPMCLVAGGSFAQLVIDLATSLTSTSSDVMQDWASS